MSDDVFNTNDQGASATNLDALVGEGKKFADNEALAKGKLESDAFIEQLKTENAEAVKELTRLQGEGSKEATVKELIDAVRKSQTEGDEATPMSDEDLSEKIRSIMQGETAATTRAANRGKGNELVLGKVDGDVDAAKAYLAERATQLGMTPASLAELSESSPTAFAKLIDPDASTVSQGTASLDSNTSLNTGGPVTEIEGHKTKAYYDTQKKEMGVAKFLDNHQMQLAYMRDATALGERFNQ